MPSFTKLQIPRGIVSVAEARNLDVTIPERRLCKKTHTPCMRFDLDTEVQDELDVVEANDAKNVSPQHTAPRSIPQQI